MEKSKQNKCYKIGEVLFNTINKELIFNRFRSVKLTCKESLILQYFLDNPNKAITLSELIANCLSQFQSDPIGTRKTVQLLSAKLELVDFIEYPYIDCYRFRCVDEPPQKLALFDLRRIKRWFNRAPQMSKVAIS